VGPSRTPATAPATGAVKNDLRATLCIDLLLPAVISRLEEIALVSGTAETLSAATALTRLGDVEDRIHHRPQHRCTRTHRLALGMNAAIAAHSSLLA
jgi:hypothetical protein